ncbi:MAG: HlyD family type I secretion periplasmic adaptor subunit [Alphaproteobacteria bacterium]|uniref:HlyD family type I secretion periplasmic adaptor subunit n=1 Tax=Thalassospira sp. TaxID=1912094 RepID=UPI0032ED67E0
MTRVINADDGGALIPTEDPQISWHQILEEERQASRQSLRKPIIAGLAVIILGFGGFLTWGFTAELDSAAVATGSVIVDSKKKVVNHYEGGILKKLLVEEGEKVTAGQTLALLDGTRSESELGQLRGERFGLMAKLARLRSEQRGQESISFAQELVASDEQYVADILSDEQSLFSKRKEVYAAKRNAQAKQIQQFEAEAQALESQIDARTRQEKLVAEQLQGIRQLADKGFATRTQLVEVENNWSDLVGDMGEFKAQKAAAQQQKAEAEINLASIEMEWQSDIATEIQEAQIALNDVTQRIRASQDVLNRLEVKAPQGGTVANIQIRTPGGVISPAEPIMDIIPEDEPLVIEARINRQDIDSVHVGSKAQIRLTAYSQRRLAPLEGEVLYVAPDQTVDEQRDSSYYILRAAIAPEELAKREGIKLRPGMPANILVLKTPRKAIDYLIDPIVQSMDRAFREE